MSGDYLATLLAAAQQQYPFIRYHDPLVVMGSGQNDYAETWPVGETGDAQYPRPADIPADRVGVQVFRPNDFKAADLAAEMLHIDPWANATRDRLLQSLSPEQIVRLKRESGDYQQSVSMGMSERDALRNAADSAMRGFTVGQWPADANQRMGYTPDQTAMLNALRNYMQTGVYPVNYRLPMGG